MPQVLRLSCLYDTPPSYVTDQPRFLNAAALVSTTLAPRELLLAGKRAEAAAGRRSGGQRHGPRPLDVDILCYDDVTVQTEDLQVPHPAYAERDFVLAPVADLVSGEDAAAKLRSADEDACGKVHVAQQ